MDKLFKDKRILITGACGTVGSELIRQLLTNEIYSPKEIIGLDNLTGRKLFVSKRHKLNKEFLQYHKELFLNKTSFK